MRHVLRMCVLAVSAAAAVFVATTPAAAVPVGCYTATLSPNGGYSYCSAGPGWHRVNLLCRVNPSYAWWHGGPAVGAGQQSIAYCNPGETRIDITISKGG